MKNNMKSGILACLLMLSVFTLQAQEWSMKRAALMTSYASTIDTANVLGEYPRPQMERENWMNLNGIWQFQPALSASEGLPSGKLSSKILVPFPVESAISGVMTHYDKMWYRRTFVIPENWKGQKLILHFDAVDYETEVFINGQSIGTHKGGYDPFAFEISSYIKESGSQELTVKVLDPTDDGGQPRGKQTLYPGGIMYTASSGIWQTVWLEPVPVTHIADIKMIPNIDSQNLSLKVSTNGPASNVTVEVQVLDEGVLKSTFSGLANTDLTIPVSSPKLWSPDSPFLYDLKITLKSGDVGIDSLKSYFGMRKISMGQVGKYKKMLLNNEFLFHFGPLDQGFWPDGLYTPPTDLAIQNDLRKTKQLGFNMIRKHIKVEPYRWYYWADKMGILVWQDMPSPNSYTNVHPDIDTLAYKVELERMVRTHWNSPCIVNWVVFNESQGQHDTQLLCDMVKQLDPSRLINQASGGGFVGAGDILDYHSYPPPAVPNSTSQIVVCGEYGGIGYKVANHIWRDGSTYVTVNTTTDLLNMYTSFADMLIQFKTNGGLSGAVYTELTDVEAELNGFLTYDRAILKGSISKYFTVNQKVINANMYLTDVVPTADVVGKSWKYTNTQPASNWTAGDFNDSAWKTGTAGFGTLGTPGAIIRTVWNNSDIWMRQEFTLGDIPAGSLDSLVLKSHHDEECEVYLNGVLAATLTGYTSSYMITPISTEAKQALIANGRNVISVHCHQTIGGQYIDAGISLMSYGKQPAPLAVSQVNASENCKIYPNPVSDILNIKRSNPATETVGIFNLLGKEVLSLNKTDEKVDISSLNNGMYFIRTLTDKITEAHTFIKN